MEKKQSTSNGELNEEKWEKMLNNLKIYIHINS